MDYAEIKKEAHKAFLKAFTQAGENYKNFSWFFRNQSLNNYTKHKE